MYPFVNLPDLLRINAKLYRYANLSILPDHCLDFYNLVIIGHASCNGSQTTEFPLVRMNVSFMADVYPEFM
jgi:hypothetical protein